MKQQASFFSKMSIAFKLKNRYFPRKFTESAAKGTITLNQRWSSVETLHFMIYINTYMIIYNTWPGFCSKLSSFKQHWNFPFLKNVVSLCGRACGAPGITDSKEENDNFNDESTTPEYSSVYLLEVVSTLAVKGTRSNLCKWRGINLRFQESDVSNSEFF